MDSFDIKILCDYTSETGARKASVATCGMVCSKQIDIVIDGDILGSAGSGFEITSSE